MANVKISALPSASTVSPADIFPIVQSGTTKQSTLANLWEPTPVGNANYTILATDVQVYTSVAFTLPRTWTLPSAASYGAGRILRVVDLLGTITGTNTLTISRAGSDTIVNGTTSTTKVLSNAGQAALLVCDGVSVWSVIGLAIVSAGGSGTVTTTGSPASGNLTKFSGATSITNGDLTGDVTTSGTLATTIANSAVTYAKIQNVSANAVLLGSSATGSGAPPSQITLGTNLSMSGSTLNAASGSGGLLAFAGSLTSVTTINATTTDTTGGITLTSQTAAASTLWRVRAHGTYNPLSSGTGRNGQITAYWGSTALILASFSIPISSATALPFDLEFLLNGTSSTAIWESGYVMIMNAANVKSFVIAPASTTVTSGAQTIDLRFSMSNTSVADTWSINGVTIERLK